MLDLVFVVSTKAISSETFEGMVLSERHWELVRLSPTRQPLFNNFNMKVQVLASELEGNTDNMI